MPLSRPLLSTIKQLLVTARQSVVQTVNTTMTMTYRQIGRLIVEDEQQGNTRAEYGKKILKKISQELSKDFGRGFSVQNLENMRNFYLTYPSNTLSNTKSQTVSRISKKDGLVANNNQEVPTIGSNFTLSRSHYLLLMRLEPKERSFYEKESTINNRSLRELKRQFDSGLYERVALSRDKQGVLEDNIKKYHDPQSPQDIVKDPYILEFLGLDSLPSYSESDLEQSIINSLEHFLLELGKGFTFVGRQQRFTFDERHFYVDLVFYNRLLSCFIIIDLKIGDLTHQDLGQMQMYVNYYDRYVKADHEKPTIGIVLCKDKSDTLVEITLPEDSSIYASQYQLYLPTKEELKQQVNQVIQSTEAENTGKS